MIAQRFGNAHDSRPRPQNHEIRQPPGEWLGYCRSLMSVFEQPRALLGQFIATEKTPPATRRDRPCHALANGQWRSAKIDFWRFRSKRDDSPDDLVAQDSRRRLGAATRVRVQ